MYYDDGMQGCIPKDCAMSYAPQTGVACKNYLAKTDIVEYGQCTYKSLGFGCCEGDKVSVEGNAV